MALPSAPPVEALPVWIHEIYEISFRRPWVLEVRGTDQVQVVVQLG